MKGVVNAIGDSYAIALEGFGAVPCERSLGLDEGGMRLAKSLILSRQLFIGGL
jgi:hypothetical protein